MKISNKFKAMTATILSICLLLPATATACSEIYLKANNVSSRTFDFMVDSGVVLSSPRGIEHCSNYALPDETPLSWTAKYGSLTFSTILKNDAGAIETGVDGINEAGFKVGTYYLPESVYPAGKGGTTLCVGSLIQYLVDNFATVDEAVADMENPAYRLTSFPAQGLKMMLHVYMHDAKGNSAMAEYVDGRLRITREPEVPVLTNTIYADAVKALGEYEDFGGTRAIPGHQESIDRFVRGAFYRKHLPEPKSDLEAVHDGFAMIQTIAVPPMFPHGCTYWTVVTDIKARKVCFRTLRNPEICTVELDKLPLAEGNKEHRLFLPIQGLSGDISASFSK